MHILNKIYISTIVFFCMQADIMHYTSLQEIGDYIKNYVNKDKKQQVKIFFDLDDTLIKSTEYKGSTTWFIEAVSKYESEGHNKATSIEKAVKDLQIAYNEITVITVEEQTKAIFSSLKEQFPIHGLTARSTCLIDITHKHLSSLDISFSEYHDVLLQDDCDASHNKGIFFCGNTPKGKIIEQIIQYHKQHEKDPIHIIFIDDSMRNVKDVHGVTETHGVPCLAIHYAYNNKS